MSKLSLPQHLSECATWPLYSVAQTQAIERDAQSQLPPNTLMQRAGLACAQLALAIAPHAQVIWMACGSGNNAGDGLEAAAHLHAWGKQVVVTWLGQDGHVPDDAQQAWLRAKAAGVLFADHAPAQFDLAIDALLGIGANRAPDGQLAQWLGIMQMSQAPVLCIDIPTGLLADTGRWMGAAAPLCNSKRHTLSLLTLKPGLFTADGKDAAGQVWFHDLGVAISHPATAWLQQHVPAQTAQPHNTHKGSFGDVVIIGGASGMSGAAVLAGLSALHGGAGRVFVGVLDEQAHHAITATHPSLMVRPPNDLDLQTASVVCGCGGGDAIAAHLPRVLSSARQLVLDADALNVIARDSALQTLLTKRSARQWSTVLTPHPLEAARLLAYSAREVQENRLHAAQQLAHRFGCITVLKGSGSVIASPHRAPVINASGNALLATAGTGDVLAGLIGAYLARCKNSFEATCHAVYAHGHVANVWPDAAPTLDAAQLAASVR